MKKLLRLLMKYRVRLIITIVISLIGFIVYVLYDVGIPTAKGTQLSVSITDGLQGELKFTNNAKYPIKISDIDTMIYTTCIFLIEPELRNLGNHFKDDYNKSINKNKLLRIYEAEGLELSGKEEWSRVLLSGLTEKGTICAYDLEVSFSYHSTSFWAEIVLKFLELIDYIDAKTEMYIRFDGCEFSQIGKEAVRRKSGSFKSELIQERLYDCISQKYSDFHEKISTIKNGSTKTDRKIHNLINKYSNEDLINLGEYIRYKISKEDTGERAQLCNLFILIYREMKERPEIKLSPNFSSENQLLTECLGM